MLALVFLLPLSSFGQSSYYGSYDPLVIKVAVIGPGDALYLWWGHIGLIIEDYESGRARFYDWGVFSFENENFVANFAVGRLIYSCAVSSPEWNLRNNINTNRDIALYTLNLPPESKEQIRQYAEWNILPENTDYDYHHFDDNCSTRLRDIIDMALNGQFRSHYENMPGRLSLREHVRRHTWFNPFFDWFLSFLMGKDIDAPVSVWEEMFLPSELGTRLEEFTYIDFYGNEQRLFESLEIKNLAENRHAVLDSPRAEWPRVLIFSCIIALALCVLTVFRSKESKAAHFIWALAQGSIGLFFGIAGTLLFFMSFFTNHDYTYRNITLLFINPLPLAAMPLGILYLRALSSMDHYKWENAIKTIWSLVFGFGIISILINIFLRQKNIMDLVLILPIAAVLSWLPDLLIHIRREYLWRWFN